MSKFRINPDLIIENIDNKISIFNPEISMLYSLNDMGSYIFTFIEKGISQKEILNNILESYDVTQLKAERDISSIFKKLVKNKIIIEDYQANSFQ